MYERFTDRARKVMQMANQEAQRLNHEYIGTEHVLLGIVREGGGVAANVLKSLDVDLRLVRPEVEKRLTPGPSTIPMGKLPMTPRVKKVIEWALAAAASLSHNYVGSEHLLLGLLAAKGGIAEIVLTKMGVTHARVREEITILLGQDGRAATERRMQGQAEQLAKTVGCVQQAEATAGAAEAQTAGQPPAAGNVAQPRAGFTADEIVKRIRQWHESAGSADMMLNAHVAKRNSERLEEFRRLVADLAAMRGSVRPSDSPEEVVGYAVALATQLFRVELPEELRIKLTPPADPASGDPSGGTRRAAGWSAWTIGIDLAEGGEPRPPGAGAGSAAGPDRPASTGGAEG